MPQHNTARSDQATPIPAVAISARRQTLQGILDPIGYYRRCFAVHPGVVRVRMSPTLPPNQVLVSDPAVLEELFQRDGRQGVSAPGSLNRLLAQVVGEQSILMLEPAPHRQRRRLLTPPFHGERLKAYGQLITRLSRKAFAGMRPGQRFEARERMQAITMGVILTAVFGLHEGERYQRLETLLHRSLQLRAGRFGSLLLFFPPLRRNFGRWSPGGRLQRIEQEIRSLLLQEVRERRQLLNQGEERADVLSLLLACRDEQGEGLSDRELHDELLTLLFAGHETTATALTWALYWIHRQPQVRQRLLDELQGLADSGESDDPEAINRLPYLGAVVNEVLRIHPVAMLLFPRLVDSNITMGGYAFNAGDVVLGCIQAVHQRPELYPDPEQFNPDRFLERSYTPSQFLPFGGGARRCLGAALAIYEMKLVLAALLQQFSLKLCASSDREIRARRRGFTLGPERPVQLEICASAEQTITLPGFPARGNA